MPSISPKPLRHRHLVAVHLVGGAQVRVEDRVRHPREAARNVLGIDRQTLVLPDVAQRADEGDFAAVARHVGGDVLHLCQELFAGVEGKAFGLLVRVVEIVLGVGSTAIVNARSGGSRGTGPAQAASITATVPIARARHHALIVSLIPTSCRFNSVALNPLRP